jgi:hypothetical protein
MTSTLFLGFVAVMTTFVVTLIDRYINRRAALRVLTGLVVWFLYASLMGHFGIISNSELRPPGISFIIVPVLLFLIFFIVRPSASAQGVLSFPLWLILGTQCKHRHIYRTVGPLDRMVVHARAMGTKTCRRLEHPGASRPAKCRDSRCGDSSRTAQSDPRRSSRPNDKYISVPAHSRIFRAVGGGASSRCDTGHHNQTSRGEWNTSSDDPEGSQSATV